MTISQHILFNYHFFHNFHKFLFLWNNRITFSKMLELCRKHVIWKSDSRENSWFLSSHRRKDDSPASQAQPKWNLSHSSMSLLLNHAVLYSSSEVSLSSLFLSYPKRGFRFLGRVNYPGGKLPNQGSLASERYLQAYQARRKWCQKASLSWIPKQKPQPKQKSNQNLQ